MLFLNTALLLGALGILIPILIHLLNRRSSRVVDWGAMNFLFESLAIRNRRIQLEEALLMASRCLLVGLLALALARPFVPPGSNVPWLFVLPLALLGVVGLGVAAVLHNEPKWRFWTALGSILALMICAGLVVFEKYLNLSRFGSGGRQDIALIVDGSTSMSLQVDGITNFERAVEEARELIKRAPRGHAFSLIVGGPAPSAKILDPTTDRAELETALDELRPLDGAMSTYHAMTLASLSLARGDQAAKQIVLFSDAQDVGWETGKAPRWNFLRDAFQNLTSEPQIVLRKMPLPLQVRNVAITDVRFSRQIVGTDRPVDISVTIENTGDEAVTPTGLEVIAGSGMRHRDNALGQMQPGAKQTITFAHQFRDAGAQTIQAVLEVEDEIPQDNVADAALNIADSLKVLIVDGRPSGRYLTRAATFPALALAPSSLTLDPTLEANPVGAGEEYSDTYQGEDYDPTRDPVRFLVEPQIVGAPELISIPDFSSYDTVILADVPRLAAESAISLVQFVEKGGGLLIAPGHRAQSDFYNEWRLADGQAFLPVSMGESIKVAGDGEAIMPSAQTLTHPAFQKVSGQNRTDFATVSFGSWWPLQVPDALMAETAVGARLNTGDPLLATRRVGNGQVIVFGGTLDTTMSNLPTRQAYLPFLHELVYALADPAAYDLNLDPGWDLTLSLSSGRHVPIGEGLRGEYYATTSGGEPVLSRIDAGLQFNWQNGAPAPGLPADGFRVEWTGKIRGPAKGNVIIEAEADDELEVWIDGKSILKATYGKKGRSRNVKMEKGKWYDFRARLVENSGEAKGILFWESRDIPRQIVPPAYFRAFAGPAPKAVDGSREGALARYDVIGPDEAPRSGELTSSDAGSLIKIHGDVSSGLYRLRIPEDHRSYFRRFLPQESTEIPFTVKRDPAESTLSRLGEEDFTFLENFVTVVQPDTLEEVLGILQGNQFGQELWKYLALGAFIFLLVEIALARWIAISRRTGEEIKIDFESREAPTAGFKEQLARIKKANA